LNTDAPMYAFKTAPSRFQPWEPVYLVSYPHLFIPT
jgi:hypothetical protein